MNHPSTKKSHAAQAAAVAFALLLASVFSSSALAQSLNWEGQTGVFITPLAYTAASPKKGVGRPVVAYHYMKAGEVIGHFHTMSATIGMLERVEVGFTRVEHQQGSSPTLSPLWEGGFNVIHGKAIAIPENAGGHKAVPAIAAGFVMRNYVNHVTGVLSAKGDEFNANDFYVVASKTVTQTKKIPLVLNLGIKASNASNHALTGAGTAYRGRVFGAAGFVLTGPAKSTIILAAEAHEQESAVKNLPGVSLPNTLVYAVRIVPTSKAKLNFDFGIGQVAGQIAPGVNVTARHQFAFGVSYGL